MYVRSTEDLAALARERRQALGLSQKQLADLVGVRRLWIIQFEHGKETVELRLVLKTLAALDLRLFVEEAPDKGTGRGEIDLDDLLAGDADDEDQAS
jgi:transcriptional regulator with XRE-family HTH domain